MKIFLYIIINKGFSLSYLIQQKGGEKINLFTELSQMKHQKNKILIKARILCMHQRLGLLQNKNNNNRQLNLKLFLLAYENQKSYFAFKFAFFFSCC